MDKTGEEDRAGSGWTTSKNGVGQTDIHSASWRRTDGNGNELSWRHWTPTGASPRNEEEGEAEFSEE